MPTKREIMSLHGVEIGHKIIDGHISADEFESRGGYLHYRGIGVHRLVMAAKIGRPLRDDENVHHRNGHRSDNHPDNLERWSRAQPCGQRADEKTRWAMAWLLENATDHSDAEEIRSFAQQLLGIVGRPRRRP